MDIRPGVIIGICGAPSSGKTTTAHLLRHKLSGRGFSREVVREYARHFIERYGQITTILEQWHVYDGQTKWEAQAASNYDLVISDSPRFLPYIYSLNFFDHRDPKCVAAALRLYELGVSSLRDYARLYLLQPPSSVEQDGVRCQDEHDAMRLYESMRQFLSSHCPDLFVEVPFGGEKDPEAYADFITDDMSKIKVSPRVRGVSGAPPGGNP